jgi:predicted methyltransferase/mono/diheme cytochrome c family protein
MKLALAGLLYTFAAAFQAAPAAVSNEAAAGRALFEGRGCLTCHTVNEQGGRRARDLSWIGLLRTPDALRRSLTDAAKHSDASALPASELDQLVAHLRTLRTMWRLEPEPSERTREAAPASENTAFFDRPERDAEERPDQLIAALDILPGSTVADIGSGTGYYTWRLAQKVGPDGKVLAVDVQQPMLDRTKAAVTQHNLRNVDYVLADNDDPRLPEKALDLVFIAYAYHEFDNPERVMAAVRRSLKPGGRVVILEYAKESNIAPASPLHKMSFEEIRREIEPMGFTIDRLFDFLTVQHGVVFKTK